MASLLFLVPLLTLQGVRSDSLTFKNKLCCDKKGFTTGDKKPFNCISRCLGQHGSCKEVQWNYRTPKCYSNTKRCLTAGRRNSRCHTLQTESTIAQDILCFETVKEVALPKGTPLQGFENEWQCKLVCNLIVPCKAYLWKQGVCYIHRRILNEPKYKTGNDSSVGIKKTNCANGRRCYIMTIGVHSLKGTKVNNVHNLAECIAALESEEVQKVDWHTSFEECFSHPVVPRHPPLSNDDNSLIQFEKRQDCEANKPRACIAQAKGLTFEGGVNIGGYLMEKDCTYICKTVSNCYAVGWQRSKGTCLIYVVPPIQKKKLSEDFVFFMIVPCENNASSSNTALVINRKGQRCLNMVRGMQSLKTTPLDNATSLVYCMAVLKSEHMDKVEWHTRLEVCLVSSLEAQSPTVPSTDDNLIQIQRKQGCKPSKSGACVERTKGLTFPGGVNMGGNFKEWDCIHICKVVSNCYVIGWQQYKGTCFIHLEQPFQMKKTSLKINFYRVKPCGKIGVQLCQLKCMARPGCVAVTYMLTSLTCRLVYDEGYLEHAQGRIFLPKTSTKIRRYSDFYLCVRIKGISRNNYVKWNNCKNVEIA